jgi:hypothetical protein
MRCIAAPTVFIHLLNERWIVDDPQDLSRVAHQLFRNEAEANL